MNILKKIALTTLLLALPSLLMGFGLPKVPGLGKKEAAAAAGVDTSALQGDLITKFIAAQAEINAAQTHLAEALGIKGKVADLKAQQQKLESGEELSKDELKKVKKNSDEANKLIRKKMKEGVELSAESKKELVKAAPRIALGGYLTKELVPAAADFVKNSGDEIKSAGFSGAMKVKNKLSEGLYLAPKVPGHLKDVLMTAKDVFAFMKSNKIEVPKEATSKLPDDI